MEFPFLSWLPVTQAHQNLLMSSSVNAEQKARNAVLCHAVVTRSISHAHLTATAAVKRDATTHGVTTQEADQEIEEVDEQDYEDVEGVEDIEEQDYEDVEGVEDIKNRMRKMRMILKQSTFHNNVIL